MLVWNDKSEKLKRLLDKTAVLESRIHELSDNLKRDEAILDMFENPVWERFVETVLVPERRRLAERRMAIPIADNEAHILINGQFNQAEALSRSKEILVAEINESMTALGRARDELAALSTQITKAEGVKQ